MARNGQEINRKKPTTKADARMRGGEERGGEKDISDTLRFIHMSHALWGGGGRGGDVVVYVGLGPRRERKRVPRPHRGKLPNDRKERQEKEPLTWGAPGVGTPGRRKREIEGGGGKKKKKKREGARTTGRGAERSANDDVSSAARTRGSPPPPLPDQETLLLDPTLGRNATMTDDALRGPGTGRELGRRSGPGLAGRSGGCAGAPAARRGSRRPTVEVCRGGIWWLALATTRGERVLTGEVPLCTLSVSILGSSFFPKRTGWRGGGRGGKGGAAVWVRRRERWDGEQEAGKRGE
ncbi:hypothetical protein F5148DRAFT_199533 [Russula earlei]|uniref:Uncharacterized protein n=1 Tax=Russula earlei TaxID=71964 RepID=A0ACC0U4Z7_9AGAM|nr:hypothetical protein F5148DRAFT_199533 [Russula earlei]